LKFEKRVGHCDELRMLSLRKKIKEEEKEGLKSKFFKRFLVTGVVRRGAFSLFLTRHCKEERMTQTWLQEKTLGRLGS